MLAPNPEEVRMTVIIISDDTGDYVFDMWLMEAYKQPFVNWQMIFNLQMKSALCGADTFQFVRLRSLCNPRYSLAYWQVSLATAFSN